MIASLRRDMIVGSLWMVLMRWSVRGIGLISTIILARILVPQDFGLIAMASILVGLLETLSSFGVDFALIQNVHATRRHFDTAWTIQVIQSAGVALVLVLAAPLAAQYFQEPRVSSLIRFLAVGVCIGGLGNIGVVAFRKDLNFSLEYRYSVYKKIISFVVTIVLALSLRNYWALAVGMVLSEVLGTLLSYVMHPYRPWFSLRAAREIWSFSQWMLTINIGNYANDKGDEFIVGKLGMPRDMGLYAVAYEISNLPTTELLYPISRALFPGYAKLVQEPERLSQAYLNVLGFITTFSVAAGFGIAVVAGDLTMIVLGPQWQDAVPLIRWLAFFGVLRAVYGQAASVLLSLGYARDLAIITWFQLVLLLPSGVAAGVRFGIIGIAIIKLVIASVFDGLLFCCLIRRTSLTVADLGRQIWRPCVAGAVMMLTLSALPGSGAVAPIVSLVRDAICGGVVYLSVLMLLWLASGRPAGTEQFVLQLMANRNRYFRFGTSSAICERK